MKKKRSSPSPKAVSRGPQNRKPPAHVKHGSTLAPQGFGHGRQQLRMTSSGSQAPDRRVDPQVREAKSKRYALARGEATPSAPPKRGHKRPRLASIFERIAKRPERGRFRTDYFETPEHKASGELLVAILNQTYSFTDGVPSPSHVLFKRRAGAWDPKTLPWDLALAVPVADVAVVSRDWQWQQSQLGFGELVGILRTSGYQPHDDLIIRDSLSLHYGEIIALAGDYFATLDDLRKDLTQEDVDDIRADRYDRFQLCPDGVAREVKMLRLAKDNYKHFTPFNWLEYARHHRNALELVMEQRVQEALIENAFGEHFLTDAFATGHVRTPREVLDGISVDARVMHNFENDHGLWLQNLAGFVWRGYGDDHLEDNNVHWTMMAAAQGRSLQRIYTARRLSPKDAQTLGKNLAVFDRRIEELEARATGDITRVNPSDLADALGDGGVGLPSLFDWIPFPVAPAPQPAKSTIANYPPLYDATGNESQTNADPEAYFSLEYVGPADANTTS